MAFRVNDLILLYPADLRGNLLSSKRLWISPRLGHWQGSDPIPNAWGIDPLGKSGRLDGPRCGAWLPRANSRLRRNRPESLRTHELGQRPHRHSKTTHRL